MPYLNTFHSLAAIAEDIRLLRRGGGPLADSENLTESQVLYWVATGLAAIQADRLATAARQGADVLDGDLVDLDLPLSWSDDLDAFVTAPVGRIARMSHGLLLREASVNGSPISVGDPSVARRGMSRFGKPQSVVYPRRGGLVCDLLPSFHYVEPLVLSVRAQVQIDLDTLLGSPDAPLPVPASWVEQLRMSLLRPAQVTLQTRPDQTTDTNPVR